MRENTKSVAGRQVVCLPPVVLLQYLVYLWEGLTDDRGQHPFNILLLMIVGISVQKRLNGKKKNTAKIRNNSCLYRMMPDVHNRSKVNFFRSNFKIKNLNYFKKLLIFKVIFSRIFRFPTTFSENGQELLQKHGAPPHRWSKIRVLHILRRMNKFA